ASALELGEVSRRLRPDRGLPAALRGSRGRTGLRAAAARRLARRPHVRARRSGDGGLRWVSYVPGDRRVRGLPERSVQLVHSALAPALLRGRRGRLPAPVVRGRAVAPRRGADAAVSDRAPVAEPRLRGVPRGARVRLPCRVAGGAPGGRAAA